MSRAIRRAKLVAPPAQAAAINARGWAGLAFAVLVFALYTEHSISLTRAGPLTFVQQLGNQLTPGTNLLAFWGAHLFRVIECALMSAGFWALGDWMLDRLGAFSFIKPSDPLKISFSLGLGMGTCSLLIFLLLALGWGYRGVVLCLFGLLATLAFWRISRQRQPGLAVSESPPQSARPSTFEKTVAALGLAFLALAFLGTTIPEIFYDALTYHLAVPKIYLDAHRLVDIPSNHFSYLPLQTSLLYFGALAVDGMYLAKLVNFSIGVSALLALYGLGRALKDRLLGLAACAVFLSTPAVLYLFWTCNSDLSVAFFLVLAFAAFWLWSNEQQSQFSSLGLSGVFAGFALASKYTAAAGVAVLAAFVGWLAVKQRGLRGLRTLAAFCLIAAAPLLPWLARNYRFTGNPIYPYFVTTLGPKSADVDLVHDWYNETREGSPGIAPISHVQKFWRDSIKGMLPPDDYIGPIFLAFLLTALLSLEAPWARGLAAATLAAYFIGLSATYIERLLIPFLTGFALLAAYAAASSSLSNRLTKVLLIAMIATNLYWTTTIMLLTPLQGLAVATGRATPQEYLSQPHTLYPNPPADGFDFVKGLHLGPDQRVLVMGDSRIFYCPAPVIGNAQHDVPVAFSLANDSKNPSDLFDRLDSAGIAVILSSKGEGPRNDSPKYVTPKNLAMITSMLNQYSDRVYDDQWTTVFRLKSSVSRDTTN